jgi:hypothetical protein
MPPWPAALQKSALLAYTAVHGLAYLPPGQLLARAVFASGRTKLPRLYEYDLGTKQWTPVPFPNSVNVTSWFVGVDNSRSVWMPSVHANKNYTSMEIKLDWVPLPPTLMGMAQ